jgi:chaperonin GroES
MIQPLEDQVALKILDEKETTHGGIVVPENAKHAMTYVRGEVVAVGPGRVQDGKPVDMNLKVGDIVFLGKRTGVEIEHDGQKVTIVRASNIFAKVK